MKKIITLGLFFLWANIQLKAQVFDDFSDGNFSANPTKNIADVKTSQCQTPREATRRKRSPGQQPTPIGSEKLVTSDATAAKEIAPNVHPDFGGTLGKIRTSGNLLALAEIGVIML